MNILRLLTSVKINKAQAFQSKGKINVRGIPLRVCIHCVCNAWKTNCEHILHLHQIDAFQSNAVRSASYVSVIDKVFRIIRATFLMVLMFHMFSLSALAQSASERTGAEAEIKPLEIGDTIPDELWQMSFPVVNDPNGKLAIKLEDYKDNKLIILDFWATWCGSCIANMPRTHKMESEIDGIKFIPITFEPKDKSAAFIKTNHITDSLNIYSIVEDKKLSKYFPHKYLPHYVWISTDGVIRAVTEGRQVTFENINRMLTSPNQTKLAKMEEMDKNRAFLLSDDVIDRGLEYYSIFLKGMRPEYTLKFFQRSKNGIINGRCHTNATLKSMYAMATYELLWQKGLIFNTDTDIIINVKEPEKLDFRLTGIDKHNPDRQSIKYKWEEDNVYSYDVILPLEKAPLLYEHVISLINDSTPYNATIEKRTIGDKEKFMLVIRDDQK
ncbi:TlpA family protein disulfide reductase [Sphingobacterium siyangense]|jgi:thiol-disulfide isomerase/thioredoxin|uniref:TlpA family protein disulfide reductase n=1 Tax=Sphingobacterium siyangense TaxID=459529 RepID=UPI003C77115F